MEGEGAAANCGLAASPVGIEDRHTTQTARVQGRRSGISPSMGTRLIPERCPWGPGIVPGKQLGRKKGPVPGAWRQPARGADMRRGRRVGSGEPPP